MNVIKVLGGIGNQMFQYAFGKVLESKGKEVAYDLSWYLAKRAYDPNYPRPCRLDYFQLQPYNQSLFIKGNPVIFENKVLYYPKIFDLTKDANFYGYWQYYPYYESIIPQLQKEFQLKEEYKTKEYKSVLKQIRGTDSVSMHVRRGDYQLHREGCFRDLKAKYYFDALSMIKGDVFIFSDDIPWCKETFRKEYFNRKITFVDLEDYQCIDLMRQCANNINTNSTFSWWAAVLNPNPDKKVICPITYQGDSVDNSEAVRYPKSWIKIEDYANQQVG